MEIESIAQRSDESPRRVRSRIEKEGLVDVLASQILERKTIDRILEQANVVEVPLEEVKEVETVDHSAGPATAEAPPAEETAAP
jgi:trigger factor